MTRKRLFWAAVLMAAAACLALAGCSQNRLTREDLIDRGYIHHVVFDLQGGKSGDREVLEQYVQDNSLVLEPGSTTDADDAPVREGYTFNAFYLTPDGEGEPWDFETDRVTSDITLYARWNSNYTITLHYGVADAEGNYTYDLTTSITVPQTSSGEAGAVTSVTISNYTILGLYQTEADARAGTNPVTISRDNPYTPEGLTAENTTVHMWANTLRGTWRLVSSASQFTEIGRNTNIYMMVDYLDLKGAAVTFPDSYAGTFRGNGATIANFRVEKARVTGTGTFSYGMFGTLAEDAQISDITFENVTFTADLSNPVATEYRAGILAGTAEEGATVQNVTISGDFTFTIVEQGTNGTPFYSNLFPNNAAALVGYGTLTGADTCNISGVQLTKLRPGETSGTDDTETSGT